MGNLLSYWQARKDKKAERQRQNKRRDELSQAVRADAIARAGHQMEIEGIRINPNDAANLRLLGGAGFPTQPRGAGERDVRRWARACGVALGVNARTAYQVIETFAPKRFNTLAMFLCFVVEACGRMLPAGDQRLTAGISGGALNDLLPATREELVAAADPILWGALFVLNYLLEPRTLSYSAKGVTLTGLPRGDQLSDAVKTKILRTVMEVSSDAWGSTATRREVHTLLNELRNFGVIHDMWESLNRYRQAL